MDLIKEIMKFANQDIIIDYVIVDQKLNGLPDLAETTPKTYTVHIFKTCSLNGDLIDRQSFDDLQEGLEWGIKKGKEILKGMIL